MVDPNTRQGKRTPVTLKIKFKSETIEQFIERYAVDVSQGGIFIRTKEPLAVGTQMRFEFQLRDASPLIAGEGTVVWTRENDPSRPAIAPGMGVRFDRLAEGSQGVLERILSEKAKQAPQRSAAETTKPPIFADTPTRVAPLPVQEALLRPSDEDKRASGRQRSDSFGEQGTPLPKPTPWHSDADEFPEEAFEEATKVRSLDELVAQTASDDDDARPAARRSDRIDATVKEPTAPTPAPVAAAAEPAPAPVADEPEPEDEPEVPTRVVDRDSAPTLPSPPDTSRPAPKLLDTTPSPRETPAAPSERSASKSIPPATESAGAKTRLGVEPAKAAARTAAQDTKSPATKSPATSRALPTEPSSKKSSAPILILLLLLVAVGAAAVWFFVLRKDTGATQTAKPDLGSAGSAGSAGPIASGGSGSAGSAAMATGSGSGSAEQTGSGSAGSASVPAAELVETTITASADKATVEVVGTSEQGPAPLKAKLEKGKAYKARVTAPGFLPLEVDVKGGEKTAAKLEAKPRVIAVSSDPAGALIFIDGGATAHSTPYEVALTKAQAARKSVRVMLRKSGFKPIERVVDASKFSEDADRMIAKLDERLAVQVQVQTPPPPHTGSAAAGSNAGSQGSGAATGSATPANGSAAGSSAGSASTPPATGSASGGTTTPSTGTPPSTGTTTGSGTPTAVKDGPKPGTASEPVPDFVTKP